MEAIGLVASIVQLTGAVTKTMLYINDVINSSKERSQVIQEAAGLLGLLTSLQSKVETASPTDAWFCHVRMLGASGGPLEQFKNSLEDLADNLKSESGIKTFGRKLVWTLDKKQAKTFLDTIERLKILIGIALQEDNL